MQNIISKLQDIIRTHYGFRSELEWTTENAIQNLLKETYSPLDHVLSVPIYEPKSGRPLAYFKIHDISRDNELAREKIRDLVQLSLQSYVNLMDQLEVSDNLIQYLQIELHPQKVIRLHSTPNRKLDDVVQNPIPVDASSEDFEIRAPKEALLLKSDSPLKVERLALSLHAAQKNNFFLRTDHMGPEFLKSLNDLSGLDSTTLFIPRLEDLSVRQQKTLQTHWLMKKARLKPEVFVVAATQLSLRELVQRQDLDHQFLKHFDFFYVLSETAGESEIQFESLNQCAQAILRAEPLQQLQHHKFSSYTKSCHLIPSCQSLFPTIH